MHMHEDRGSEFAGQGSRSRGSCSASTRFQTLSLPRAVTLVSLASETYLAQSRRSENINPADAQVCTSQQAGLLGRMHQRSCITDEHNDTV